MYSEVTAKVGSSTFKKLATCLKRNPQNKLVGETLKPVEGQCDKFLKTATKVIDSAENKEISSLAGMGGPPRETVSQILQRIRGNGITCDPIDVSWLIPKKANEQQGLAKQIFDKLLDKWRNLTSQEVKKAAKAIEKT